MTQKTNYVEKGRKMGEIEKSEKEALKQIYDIAYVYGFGNCIAFLKRAWIQMLKDKHGVIETNVDSSPYSEDTFNNIIGS